MSKTDDLFIDKQYILEEYLRVSNQLGKPATRRDFVRNSPIGWKYERFFDTFTEFRKEALSQGDIEFNPDNPPARKPKELLTSPEAYRINAHGKRKTSKVLIFSDVHVPFHDVKVWAKVLKTIKENDFDTLILNGDFMDLFSISRFTANSLQQLRDITLGKEYEAGNLALDQLEKAGNWKEKVYLYGNHEERFKSWLKDGDNAKYTGAIRTPKEALSLEERGYIALENAKEDYIVLSDRLEVMHGTYSNKYFTNKHLEHLSRSVIIGHLHTQQVFTSPSGQEAYSLGFLGDPKSPVFNYSSRLSKKRWKQGFSTVTVNHEQNTFFVNMVRIDKQSFEYNGKVY